MIKPLVSFAALTIVVGCASEPPRIEHASEHTIQIGVNTLSPVNRPSFQMIEMAAAHCGKYGKNASFRGGGNTIESLSTAESYLWQCVGY